MNYKITMIFVNSILFLKKMHLYVKINDMDVVSFDVDTSLTTRLLDVFSCVMGVVLFVDLLVGDFPHLNMRYLICYNLLSISYNFRFIFNGFLISSFTPSMTSIFSNIAWYERECWDLYGIFFIGNRDLRRILNDYGFFGYPFRKDFPLSGYSEIAYSYRFSSLIYLKIKLIQEYRFFSNNLTWKFN